MTDPIPTPAKPKSVVHHLAPRLSLAWDWLTRPAVTLQDRERRQQARLLSSLLLALIATIMLILLLRTIGGVLWQDFTTWAAAGAIATLIAIYGLSRTQHYTASATLTVAALFALIHTAPLWADRPDHALFYAALPIVLSSILLSLPAMFSVAAVSMGNVLLLTLISPRGAEFYLAPLSHTLMITAIILTFIYHRDRLERKRQAALRTSESNYRLLLEQASEGIFITDPQGNYLMVNSKGRTMLGASTDQLLRCNINDMLLSEELVKNSLRFADLAVGKTVIAEGRLSGKNGRIMPVEVSVKRLEDGRLQAIVRDITERKQAEEALRAQEERYRIITELMSDYAYAFRVEPDGTFTEEWDTVDSFKRLTGYAPKELGTTFSLYHPEDQEQAEGDVKAVIAGQPCEGEYRIITKSGELRWMRIYRRPVWDPQQNRVVRFYGVAQDITARKQVEEALRAAQQAQKDLINSIDGIVWEADAKTFTFSFVSSQAERLLGYPLERWLNEPNFWANHIYLDDREQAVSYCLQSTQEMRDHEFEYRMIAHDGRLVWLHDVVTVIVEHNEAVKLRGVMVDITTHKQLEEQLRQAQKMEAIGRLAGGVAHDFNNILTVIKGYTGLLLQDLEAHDPVHKDLRQIHKSAERAAALTHQLLAFSRQQMLQPQVLDLNSTVTNIDEMLRRLIGEDINLMTRLDPALGRVKADPGQIEQVIVNLALNARDAMPQGGRLIIETKNVYLDEAYTHQHVGIKTGPYVRLAMSDTGSGMDETIRSHIFEPFFTTKEQGKGTGLGLATVHGIVNQSGGHISVSSQPGQGTTFQVYLPEVEEASHPAQPDLQGAPAAQRGSETILLVEDELSVRELTRRILLDEGYLVLEASDGEEAIRVAQQHQGSIDLLVTDVVMPGGMSGRQLVEYLTPLRREMKVLYMSGYTDDAIVRHGVREAGIAFLQKPFTVDRLTGKVRQILDVSE